MALFPFLAVLVCVMGALVPLLLGISRIARRQALCAAQQRAAQSQQELQSELELVRWRIEQLKLSRQKTEEDLRQVRDQLAHYEDHARRLEAEGRRLQNLRQSIDQPQGSLARTQLQALWQQLQGELAWAQRRLEEAQAAAQQRKPSYAIIPYEGPSGTRRRPIYIECTASAVIIQPEGIRLTAEDFRGPMKKDNPLAATLRAIEAYLDRNGLIGPQAEQRPYPLFLVRASGVAAYAVAREAMAAWGSDFGYELIDDDWQLSYPQADPQLVEVAQAALKQARQIHSRLIAAAPRLYASDRPVYAVSPGRGGAVQIDGRSGTGRYVPQAPAPPVAGHAETPRGEIGTAPNFQTAQRAAGSPGRGPAASQAQPSRPTDWGTWESPPGAVAGAAEMAGLDGPSYSPGGTQRGGAGSHDRPTAPLQSAGHEAQRPLQEGFIVPPPPDGVAAQPARGQHGPQDSSAGKPLRPGQWEPDQSAEPRKRHDLDAKQVTNGKPKTHIDRRNADWGLPEVASGAIPLARPIKINCLPDRLVLLPEQGVSAEKTISLGPRTADALEELILAVWERIGNWGMAGKSMYWRPVLHVSVAPGAEQRFEELIGLLDGSGLEVQRR